jgi:hypothetical protein
MYFAADYPFLNIFWSMIIFFAWVIWIWMVIAVLADVFARQDLSGWGKAAWSVFVIVLPFLAVLFYLITNSKEMALRKEREARTVRPGGAAAEIEKAKQLLDSGAVTQGEFDALKAKALA